MPKLFLPFLLSLILSLFNGDIHAQIPSPPTGLTATAYDSHIELSWNINAEPNLSAYRIYRAEEDMNFEYLASVNQIHTRFIDFIGEHDRSFQYKITAVTGGGDESDFSATVPASTFEMTDEQLLDMVQEYTFRYFWDFAHPVSGMARERNNTSIVTTGGSGFGIMAILVGIERAFITYDQGVERLLKIVNFLETADRFHGAFPHWMNGATGETIPFSEFDDGADLVETAFLMQGLLTVRECISGDTPEEVTLRQKITQLWEEVEWSWFRKGVQDVLYWHWSPNFQWQMDFQIRGFNEAHIVYLLAVASPTYPISENLYHEGWAGGNYTNGGTFFGFPLPLGPYRGGPLFFAHYSYQGFDPRYKKDSYANYFNQNVYHTLINRAYCIDNPQNHLGYSEESWGLTASDDPWGYLAHEPTSARDNGTITPTAALSSMPYTPGHSKDALKHFYRDLGDRLWGPYGFYDAFNLNEDWFASSYLAIDQGPIINMIENYRTELLWDCFMANPEIQDALDNIGFEVDSTLVTGLDQTDLPTHNIQIFPNPVSENLTIQLQPFQAEKITLELFDLNGTRAAILRADYLPAGQQPFTWNVSDLPNGLYFLKMNINGQVTTTKVLILH